MSSLPSYQIHLPYTHTQTHMHKLLAQKVLNHTDVCLLKQDWNYMTSKQYVILMQIYIE